jgi:hypothetical protein
MTCPSGIFLLCPTQAQIINYILVDVKYVFLYIRLFATQKCGLF